jgi:hypothetical protein
MLSWWRRQRMLSKLFFIYVALAVVGAVVVVVLARSWISQCDTDGDPGGCREGVIVGTVLILFLLLVGMVVLAVGWIASWVIIRVRKGRTVADRTVGVRPGSWLFAVAILGLAVTLLFAIQDPSSPECPAGYGSYSRTRSSAAEPWTYHCISATEQPSDVITQTIDHHVPQRVTVTTAGLLFAAGAFLAGQARRRTATRRRAATV